MNRHLLSQSSAMESKSATESQFIPWKDGMGHLTAIPQHSRSAGGSDLARAAQNSYGEAKRSPLDTRAAPIRISCWLRTAPNRVWPAFAPSFWKSTGEWPDPKRAY